MAHPTLDLATFTREDAIARYHVEYWAPIQGDALPPPVAFAVFDGAVQHDPVTAIRLLQRVVNAYPYDGRMGPHTLARTVAADVRTTVHHYCARRAVYYAQLPHGVEAHMYGWMRRLFATYTAALV
jgi:lysozyme family protein